MCIVNSMVVKFKFYNYFGGVGVLIIVDLIIGVICGFC